MGTELQKCVASCRSALVTIGLLSGGSNLLALTGSIFMLAVYDRVIPSGSIPTLVAVGLVALVLYGLQAGVDILRGRLLTRIGLILRESFSSRIFDIIVRQSAVGDRQSGSAIRDLDQIQSYMSSIGPVVLFDLPWLPVYLAVCFAFHPYIGLTVMGGALVLIALTFVSNMMTKAPATRLTDLTDKRVLMQAATQTNSETIQAMGMTLAMSGTWNKLDSQIVAESRSMADTQTTLATVSKVFRIGLQSFVLAVGAYLVIKQDATGGIMIASSILSSRALAPIEQAIANWKSLVATRHSWKRLGETFKKTPVEPATFVTPPPSRSMTCQNLSLAVPNVRRLIVRDINFQTHAGQVLGIIGATGSGKSTLARALVGLWEPAIGAVHLDGIAMSRWTSFERGRFIGYLPQNVTLFEGTIAQNIARFDPYAEAEQVIRVAKLADVYDLISRLPDGFDTKIGPGGSGVSGGQAQRIGLARALYGDPFLIVLDEPNSNLDSAGEAALQNAIDAARKRGSIVVLVTHRPNILSVVDQVLMLHEGRVARFGLRSDVLDLNGRIHPVQQVAAQDQKPRIVANASGGAS